jgi:hypothetical protein
MLGLGASSIRHDRGDKSLRGESVLCPMNYPVFNNDTDNGNTIHHCDDHKSSGINTAINNSNDENNLRKLHSNNINNDKHFNTTATSASASQQQSQGSLEHDPAAAILQKRLSNGQLQPDIPALNSDHKKQESMEFEPNPLDNESLD